MPGLENKKENLDPIGIKKHRCSVYILAIKKL
jgi:hypothetical protein